MSGSKAIIIVVADRSFGPRSMCANSAACSIEPFDKANTNLTSLYSQRDSNSLFTTVISFELAVGFGGLILGLLIGPEARLYVPQLSETKLIGQGLLWGTVAAIPMTLVALALSTLPLESIRALHRVALRQLSPLFAQFTGIQLVLCAVAAGVCEEIFFRGWLQCLMTGPIDSNAPWQPHVILGVVIAGLVFGICHALTPMYFVLASLAGTFLGVLLVESSNLLIPITAHAVYDIIMLIRLRRMKPDDLLSEPNQS